MIAKSIYMFILAFFLIGSAGANDGGLIQGHNVSQSNSIGGWNYTFGGSSTDWAKFVQQTSDGGYIMAGYTWSSGEGSDYAWLIKTDSQGIKLWDKTFGGSMGEHAESVQQTSDGGYIIAGGTKSFGAGSSDAWLIKTDASGNEKAPG
jgi:hypothetical protein